MPAARPWVHNLGRDERLAAPVARVEQFAGALLGLPYIGELSSSVPPCVKSASSTPGRRAYAGAAPRVIEAEIRAAAYDGQLSRRCPESAAYSWRVACGENVTAPRWQDVSDCRIVPAYACDACHRLPPPHLRPARFPYQSEHRIARPARNSARSSASTP